MGLTHSPYLSGGFLTLDDLRTIAGSSVTREKMLPLETLVFKMSVSYHYCPYSTHTVRNVI